MVAKSTACITRISTGGVATIAISIVAIDIESVDIAIDIAIAGVDIGTLPLLLLSL